MGKVKALKINKLTSMQSAMLFYSLLEENSRNYYEQFCFYLEGTVRLEDLKKAWQEVVNRHEIFRTDFRWKEAKNQFQIVLSHKDAEIYVEDISELTDQEALDAYIEKYKGEDLERELDFERGRLNRLSLIKLSDQKWFLCWTFHHILLDGWSVPIVLGDFFEIYHRLGKGEPLPPQPVAQFSDYLEWLKKQDYEQAMGFWQQYMADFEVPTLLPYDQKPKKNEVITKSIDHELTFDKAKTAEIAEFCRQQNITMNAFLQTAWGILLQKYNQSEQSCFGMTVSGRPLNLKNVESIVGIFINTLPVLVKREGEMTLSELMKRVNDQLVEIREYEYISLAEIQNLAPVTGGELFDSIIVFENYPVNSAVAENQFEFTTQFESASELTNYNFTIVVSSGEEMVLRLSYNAKLFKPSTIQRMEAHLTQIVEALLENPDLLVTDLSIISESERQLLVEGFNQTQVDFSPEKTVQELFEAQVAETPDQVAVTFRDQSLTYRELNERANQLARTLRAKGVEPDQPVGMLVDKSLEMIIGVLAIIKAGGAYLPIDIDYPENRVQYMLEDSEAQLLLTQPTHLGLAEQISFTGELIDLTDQTLYQGERANLENRNQADHLIYIIYTSGSTGQPKGVMVEHKNVNRLITNSNMLIVDQTDHILQTGSLAFDASTFEIWGSLLNGATLYLITKDELLSAERFATRVQEYQISQMWLTAPLFNQMLEEKPEIFQGLNTLIVGGDALSPKHINFVRTKYPKLKVVNGYGPTESTTFTTYFVIDQLYTESIPIGYPVSNTQVYILDPKGNLQPIGVAGELCIGGEGLARGYLKRPELTEEKFVANSFAPGEKMYKTGDLARWLPDGKIEFLGRVDHQVKIRGFRIELGEIEERLLNFSEVTEVVVMDRVDENGVKYLCAYLVADRELAANELRAGLAEELPDYMIPSYFIQLAKMPLTANGKIDRRSLPEPDGQIQIGTEYVAATNEGEEKMVEIWKEVLGVKQVGIRDNFFELGGHSLKATQLASKVLKEFNVELPLKAIFTNPTVEELVASLSKTEETTYAAIEPVAESEYYPVSSAQKRLYAIYQMEGANVTYNSPNATIMEGELDVARLTQVLQELIQRHESLRTSFAVVDGQAMQKIHPEVEFKLDYREAQEEELPNVIKEFIRPFDLAQAPLLRAGLVKFGAAKHLLILDLHHIISDGTSMSIFFAELIRLYEGEKLAPLRIQYKDFAQWQNQLFASEEMAAQEQYWLETFADEVPVLNLPTDYPRPTEMSFAGDTLTFSLNKSLSDGLKAVSALTGATLYMTLLASLNLLFSKYAGQSEIVIGSPSAGRRHADLENILGMFINTLALRNHVDREQTFVEFLGQVKENTLKAFDNQDYQFEMLVEQLQLQRDLSRNPLFDIMFILQNTATVDGELQELKLSSYPFENKVAQFDLVFNAYETGLGINFNVEYATKLFKRSTLERMVQHLTHLIRQVIQNPEIKIAEIELTTPEERQQLLVDFNETATELGTGLVNQLFEEQVAQTPEQIVAVFGEKSLTYREANQKANQVARVLREKGVQPDQIVGIMVDRSLEMLIGLMAIMKAGGAYLPLDPMYPEERIEYMLTDSQVKIVLTQDHLVQRFTDLDQEALSLEDQQLYTGSGEDLAPIHTPENLAYLIYTSGSTGKPKGVMIEHRNILNTILWRKDELQLNTEDKVLQLLSYSFDGFVVNFLTPLISGAQLVMISNDQFRDPMAIKEIISRHGVTHFNGVPSLFSALLECMTPAEAKSLRKIALGGEQITASLIQRSRELNPELEIINEYGPTEASVMATVLRETPAEAIIPIGRPIANTQIYIVDESMQLAPINVPGELCIAGAGLARGYLNRPELEAEKFVPNPFEAGAGQERLYKTGDLARWLPNGMIQFLGRVDEQVKIRGYRIELGEIEAQLLTHPELKEVVVLDRAGVDGSKYLCAYVVSDKKLPPQTLQGYLGSRLPEYMIPSFFVQLEEIPLTTNGKVDRRALPEPDGTVGIEYVAPTTEAEAQLAEVWAAILGREQVGIRDNFFSLGGDSIKAIQIIARANQHAINISVKDIFKYKTIEEILTNVNYTKGMVAISQEEVVGEVPLTPVQRWFFELGLNQPHFWNQTNMFALHPEVDLILLEKAFQKLLIHHDALRMGYRFAGDKVVQYNRGVLKQAESEESADLSELRELKLELIDLTSIEPKLREQQLKEACLEIQDQLDLEADWLLKAVVFDLGEAGKRLFIAIHHLVIDGVSWRILLEDLQNLYNSNLEAELPLKTTSFKEWSERLHQYVATEELDLTYWEKIDPTTIKSLVTETNEYREVYLKDQERVGFTLTKEETDQLLTKANWAYNTEINDILLSALTLALTELMETEQILLTLEGHGREEMIAGVDLSRTIGWFTAGYPVYLKSGAEVGATIREVKENLRQIPNKGLNFGLARYLAGHEKLQELEAEISFNYLGQFDDVVGATEENSDQLLSGCTEDYGSSIHEANQHPTILDVVGMVTGGSLKMMISYNRHLLTQEWATDLKDLYQEKLQAIIEHTLNQEAKTYSASDFEVEDSLENDDLDLLAELYDL